MDSRFERFVTSRVSPQTQRTYWHFARITLGDLTPDDFLTMAEKDKRGAEELLIDNLKQKRGKWSEANYSPILGSMRSFQPIDGLQDTLERRMKLKPGVGTLRKKVNAEEDEGVQNGE
jgi:hypothetical protein